MMHKFSILILLITAIMLTACGQGDSVEAASDDNASNAPSVQSNGENNGNAQGPQGRFQSFESAYLDSSYENALNIAMQLAIGTMQLEGTEKAVTAEQAASLLPLWQAIQGGSIQEAAERNAVFRGIESAMTESQMQAIAAMQLTNNDMRSWAEANGIELTDVGQGGPGGRGGAFAELSEEERTELRDMEPEARQARLTELGIEIGNEGPDGNRQGDGQGPRTGRLNTVYEPLIEMLTQRTTE